MIKRLGYYIFAGLNEDESSGESSSGDDELDSADTSSDEDEQRTFRRAMRKGDVDVSLLGDDVYEDEDDKETSKVEEVEVDLSKVIEFVKTEKLEQTKIRTCAVCRPYVKLLNDEDVRCHESSKKHRKTLDRVRQGQEEKAAKREAAENVANSSSRRPAEAEVPSRPSSKRAAAPDGERRAKKSSSAKEGETTEQSGAHRKSRRERRRSRAKKRSAEEVAGENGAKEPPCNQPWSSQDKVSGTVKKKARKLSTSNMAAANSKEGAKNGQKSSGTHVDKSHRQANDGQKRDKKTRSGKREKTSRDSNAEKRR